MSPAGGHLDVFISDPVTSTNVSMKELIPDLYYLMEYWEGSADTQVTTLSDKTPTRSNVHDDCK